MMEIVQAMAAGLVALLVVSAVMQVIFSYALQVISEKNDLPDFTSFLSWIPLLNIYPLIRCGGGSFKKFVLGIVGCVVLFAAVAAGGAAAGMGGVAVGAAGALVGIGAVVYMAGIAMATAERRGLGKWVGLLTFVPVVNFLVYPYIAFHDGFRAPNKVGLVLGLLLAFGPLPGQIKMMNTMTEQAQAMQQKMAEQGIQLGAEDGGAANVGLEQALGGLGAAMEIGAQLATLQSMDPSDPQQAALMRNEVAEIARKLDEHGASLGPEAASEMQRMLREQEARLGPSAGIDSGDGGAPVVADLGAPAEPEPPARALPVADTPVGDRTGIPAPPPAKLAPITASIGRNGDRGFPVPTSPGCPEGTTMKGAAPPDGLKQWCEKVGADAGIKHGWMTEWHSNGAMAVAGEYRDGLRVGIWTRWYPNGVKRVQARFLDGMQDGALIAWDETGAKVHEGEFTAGSPASRR